MQRNAARKISANVLIIRKTFSNIEDYENEPSYWARRFSISIHFLLFVLRMRFQPTQWKTIQAGAEGPRASPRVPLRERERGRPRGSAESRDANRNNKRKFHEKYTYFDEILLNGAEVGIPNGKKPGKTTQKFRQKHFANDGSANGKREKHVSEL